jgi:hypothetical protein
MIPEPSTILLFGIGLISAWVLRRNKKSFAKVSFDMKKEND